MNSIVNEKTFEELIEQSLLKHGGYIKGDPSNFDQTLAIDIPVLLEFIKNTQKSSWDRLAAIHGSDIEKKFIYRLCRELDSDSRGMLDCIRNGIIDHGVPFKLAFFKPVSNLNPETMDFYEKNILTVTRQVHYSRNNEKSIDILLSLNGLPIATIELKNAFTGQSVSDAKTQYKYDRDENEPLFGFKKRALVHFAVDSDEVYMTTRLNGKNTKYLPFNKGYDKGAGNPPAEGKHKTHYLWEDILVKDSLMDIIARFIYLHTEEFAVGDKKIKKETMIFPRYHQLDSVRKLTDDALSCGSGKNYLIQHSAGSGKSNSIAWLAYRLASIHDKDDKRIFGSVIVVTDRLVLDKQLQDTIYQFEHKRGVVEKIDKNSRQLADALIKGTNIIITTLQKFPFILDKIKNLTESRYAVIVDEAHSSQGGEMAADLKRALMIGEDEDIEDGLREVMIARGRQKNISFFAFTATPKPKTIETFGQKDENGEYKPFHLYSMRQAIEEGFILDVLENYINYKSFYKLSKKIDEDPNVNKKKASRAIARFVSLHPHQLAQKTEVIIEHFRQVTMKKIGGRAKAMVAASSREHVVRYKQAFDRYLIEKGYSDIKILVAFSGKVLLGGIPPEFTEAQMNGFGERELPERFKEPDYQILLVAEKYQTGFDQPLLHTMYVDKKLDGVKAVQTLSRLNRVCSGKEDTFILDFVNEREGIFKSFQPYYEAAMLAEATDPNALYDIKANIESFNIIDLRDVEDFCGIFFKSEKLRDNIEHGQLNSIIDKAVDKFNRLEKMEDKESFKKICGVFIRLYSFIAQIMPFSDTDLEKFYAYVRFLLRKLPKRTNGEVFRIGDEVALEYYRLQKIASGRIELQKNSESKLKPLIDAGRARDNENYALLSEIINIYNEHFKTDFKEADRLFFDQIEESLLDNEDLAIKARSNSIENFKYGFGDTLDKIFVERMDQNMDIFQNILNDNKFKEIVENYFLNRVYTRFNSAPIIDKEKTLINEIVSDSEFSSDKKFVEYLPVYSLEAAASGFSREEHVEAVGWMKAPGRKLNMDMFIAKVVGHSMEPTIPDGSYCIFRLEGGGSRNGTVVLVESRQVADNETNQKFTVKRYNSEKEYFEDGSWIHKRIILSPNNKKFEPIILENVPETDFKVVAEFISTI